MTEQVSRFDCFYVRTNFLITKQIRDYLAVWYSMENKGRSILEL